jgi:antitoxin (DNA-binding transcriptional repressor) of toxin-antitoxin stability system
MQAITLEQAQSRLAEIIDALAPGEEVVLTRGEKPVARLVAAGDSPRPVPGRGRGMLTIVSEDEEHLEHFAEYLP